MIVSPTFDFEDAFAALTGHQPFPWQRRLFGEHFLRGTLPPAVDIPTGLGKTAVIAVWLLARAAGAALPRRLVYVVDRRAVVDQATAFAGDLRESLEREEGLAPVRQGLRLCGRRLPISTLRGRHADNREWMADPSAPAIVVGTVDMVGSRLLFEGYGVSRRMRPYAAGLLGCDTLVMLDEAHLARPFERLLKAIQEGQRRPTAEGAEAAKGYFAGPAACNGLPPPFRVLPLSATLGLDSDETPFRLDDDDRANGTVRTRLAARKSLTVEDLEAGAGLAVGGIHPRRLAERLGHDVDRPVLQVQPAAVGQHRHAGGARHQGFPSRSGHGLARGQGSARWSATSSACSRGTTRSTWPPSAANSARLSVNSMGATRAGVGT